MSRTSGLVFSLGMAATIAASTLLVPVRQASADDPQTDETNKRRLRFSTLVALPTSDDLESKLEVAPAYIKGADWATATQVLQWVLDHPEDAFVPVRRTGPDGKETIGWISARAEANRILGTLPPKGREFYELQHGAKAAELLAAARRAGDLLHLAQVAERYRHTAAGQRAADLLGTYHLDRGQYTTAARYFRRLLAQPNTGKLSPLTLLKASLAFRRAGDESAATAAWKLLATRARKGLRIGDRVIPLADLKKEFARAPGVVGRNATVHEWLVFRGSATRAAQAAGKLADLRKSWDRATIGDGPAGDWIDGALKRLKEKGQPALSAASPITAAGMIVYRSHRAVHAVDPKTGELLWESPLHGSLEELANGSASLSYVGSWATAVLQAFPHALLENSTVGALSADARQLYVVEDLALLTIPNNYSGFVNKGGAGLDFKDGEGLTGAVYQSKLLAIDLKSGRAVWQADGREKPPAQNPNQKLSSHFLGPPLPLGGKLYSLMEQDQVLRLVCLDPANGHVSWAQRLSVPKRNVLIDGARRLWAAHPAHAEGVLVCPTNAGAVVAVDLTSRSLLWAHAYREEPPPPPLPPGRGRFRRWNVPVQVQLNLEVKWKYCAPLIAQGKVLLAAPDGTTLDCLDLWTGALLWRINRGDDDLYLGGVFKDSVVVIGRRQCTARRLRDGEVLWVVETGEPSGQGVVAGKFYHLPVTAGSNESGPGVQVIDLEKGAIARHIALPAGQLAGNLLFFGNTLLSQTANRIAAYAQTAEKK